MTERKRCADVTDCHGLCQASSSPGVFQNVTGLKTENMKIYHCYIKSRNALDYEKNVDTSRVLILENKSPSDVAVNNNTDPIGCSKCRCLDCLEILRETFQLLQNIKTMKKNEVRGICHKCYTDNEYKSIKCVHCARALDNFLGKKRISDEDILERGQNWLEKIENMNESRDVCLVCKMHKIKSQQNILGEKKLRVNELFHRFLNKSCQCAKSSPYSQRHLGPAIDICKFMDYSGDKSQSVCLDKNIEDLTKLETIPANDGKFDERANKSLVDAQRKSLQKNQGGKNESDRKSSIQKTKKEKSKKSDKDKDKLKDKGKDKGNIKGEDRDKDNNTSKGKDKGKDNDKDINRDNDKDRKKYKDKDKGKDNDKDRKKDKDKDKGEDNDKDRKKDKDKDKGKDNDKDRKKDNKDKAKKEKTDPSETADKIVDDLLQKQLQQSKAEALLREQEKAKALENEKRKRAEELKLKRATQTTPVMPPEVKKITASPSDLLRFFEKSKEQRNKVGDYQTKSLLHPFDDDICLRFGLLDLPKFGLIYRQDLESLSTLQILLSKTEKANLKIFDIKKDKFSIPRTGEDEKQVSTLEYKIRRSTNDILRKVTSLIDIDDLDSEMSVIVDAINKQRHAKMIFGTKVRKYNAQAFDEDNRQMKPLLFAKEEDFRKYSNEGGSGDTVELGSTKNKTKPDGQAVYSSKGNFRYALSNREFINNGWTMLPMMKVVRKINVYRMRLSQPEFNWFICNKNKSIQYDSGQTLAKVDKDGHGNLFYRNGQIALKHYAPADTRTQKRYIIYSCGVDKWTQEPAPINILACFDWLGNGVVYDEAGQVRLKYDQNEGVITDRTVCSESHWKWHTLNEPPELCRVMVDNEILHKEPNISKYKMRKTAAEINQTNNEEILAIEREQSANEKIKKLCQKFKPFEITIKVLKINDHFSLKIVDQARVYLIFRDGKNSVRINMGMVLDPREIINADKTELGEIGCPYGRLLAETDSLCEIKDKLYNAKRRNNFYTKRKERIRGPLQSFR